MKIFKNARISGKLQDFAIEDGIITEIGKIEGQGIDLKEKTVIPGLIDIHMHYLPIS